MDESGNIIKKLDLSPHPEGGFFKEIYRSTIRIAPGHLPHGYKSERRLATSIYYMLVKYQYSKFHRIRSDELWYYHQGCGLKIHEVDKEGNKHIHFLGTNIEKGEKPQVLIPAGNVFAAELTNKDAFGLYGCMVSPGFDYADFELFEEDDLSNTYPQHKELFQKFC